jgi:beta-xylosidase
MNLIAKPIIKGEYWVVTNGKEKVGNVMANNSGFNVTLNGNSSQFKNTKAIEKQVNIEFENIKKTESVSSPFNEFPTVAKVYNSILDIKRKLHLFTKTPKSKCYYAAGWFVVEQGTEKSVVFCPKYIFLQRYPYQGPYKTKSETQTLINNE